MKFFASPLDRFRRNAKSADDTSDRIGVVKVEHTPTHSSDLPVMVSQHSDKLVVSVGAIALQDLSEVRDLGAFLIQLLEDESPGVLVIDLGKLNYLSSESLNQLINVNCHARERGTKLVLTNLCQPLLEVFRITRLDRLFDVS
jgi:anti-anti-sigma factor